MNVVLRSIGVAIDGVSGEAVSIHTLKLPFNFFYLWLNSNSQFNSDFHLFHLFMNSGPHVHILTDMSGFEGRTLNQNRLKCYFCSVDLFHGIL